jgi:hypothetical protein
MKIWDESSRNTFHNAKTREAKSGTMTSVSVYCRVRPFNKRETEMGNLVTPFQIQKTEISIPDRAKNYSFDYNFGMKATQIDVFNVIGNRVVESVSLISITNSFYVIYFQHLQLHVGPFFSLLKFLASFTLHNFPHFLSTKKNKNTTAHCRQHLHIHTIDITTAISFSVKLY